MLGSKHGRNFSALTTPAFWREGRKVAKASQQRHSQERKGSRAGHDGWASRSRSNSSMAEKEGGCVDDLAEAGASLKSLGKVPEVPRVTWDAGSKQRYAYVSHSRAHKPRRNEQSQLLLLHWAERCSSCRATELPLVSLQLEGAGSKDKITISLTLI